jgi:hypothetical protein
MDTYVRKTAEKQLEQTLNQQLASQEIEPYGCQAGMIGFVTLQQSAPSQMTWQDSNASGSISDLGSALAC